MVIAIIALLAALLLPGLKQARVKGQRASGIVTDSAPVVVEVEGTCIDHEPDIN